MGIILWILLKKRTTFNEIEVKVLWNVENLFDGNVLSAGETRLW